LSPKNKHKEEKNAVLLIGSGFGSLKLAEDLAQSGIPVVWITNAHHFLELPEGEENFTGLPEDLNFQFRPLYLRVTRHPLVTPLTHSQLTSIDNINNEFKSVILQEPRYIDYDLCTGCGRCMEVCPLNDSEHPPLSRTPAYCPSRALELDKRNISICRVDCPLNVNVQAYMALTAANRFDEALAVIRETNPLPGICGRICNHPCEKNCRRQELDQPVSIRAVKRFLADYEIQSKKKSKIKNNITRRPEKIAIIGSGPSGLTAAHYLNKEGFQVTIFEAHSRPGGMLRSGINSFRLPRKILDAEIKAIKNSGVKIITGEKITSIDELTESGFNAVLICAGTHGDIRLNIPGEDQNGVLHCVKFLYGVNTGSPDTIGKRTVVIGAGNSAMDAARTALRLGSTSVSVLGIEKEDEMPAHKNEIMEAREEGVKFILGAAPVAFEGDGNVKKVIYKPAHWEFQKSGAPPVLVFDSDETSSIAADTVIVSIGQKPCLPECGLDKEIKTSSKGYVIIDEKYRTSKSHVFAAGDIVTNPSTVINSMAEGRKAAAMITEFFIDLPSNYEIISAGSRGTGDYVEIPDNLTRENRLELRRRQSKIRKHDFDEVDICFTAAEAVAEAQRCLQCGSCCECLICETSCSEIGAIDHFRKSRQIYVSSPCVIIADKNEISNVSIIDNKGIFYLDEVRKTKDLITLMLAGSSSAGRVMSMASAFRKPAVPGKKIQMELERAEPGDEQTIGVFICSCNSTLAPKNVLEKIRSLMLKIPNVKHCEIIFSFCHPEGSDRIAAAFKKFKLTRAVCASCVCCPLEFQCISCNDQRTRPRIHLFDRHRLERSQFEMINIKDHLNAEDLKDDEIVEKAIDLLRGAFIRARYIKQLRQGFTEIGNKILILGGSEIGINCALNLDLQGFRVRLVHKCRLKDNTDFPDAIRSRNIDKNTGNTIDHVEEAVIEEIRGHIGDFTIIYNENGRKARWHADMICLTDMNIISLAIPEDMSGLKKVYRYNFSFFHTPQPGVYRVLPRTLDRLDAPGIGTALAAQVAKASAELFLKDHELSPRIDPDRCRGCGRCADICPFGAIKMIAGPDGIYTSEVLRHNCVGCGGCVGRCPVTAMDMPYFSNQQLIEVVAGTLTGGHHREKN
jgi:NADPH-dependent glutamate synthase beta subunit-like oxidoreductase/NAD-dependent dihydropyrimidine dehydrogenase PreA subunit